MSLSLVYQPEGSPIVPAVDIVAIHGLGGDPINTWTHPQSNAFWLRDFLPQRIPDARILTFGYNATVAFGHSTANVVDHAKSLLGSLVDKREEDEESTRPLIFIVHSLGGIVVKQALLSARLESRYRNICDATVGIIFFGTPHRGSEQAVYGKVLANIAQTMLHKPTSPLLQALQTNGLALQQLTTDFRHQLPRYQIVSFYEQNPMKPFKHLIVEKYSALLEIENEEQIPVAKDHSTMCKFETGNDDTFEKTWKRIQRMRKELKLVARQEMVPHNQHYEVPHLLSPIFTGRNQICHALESSLILSTTPRQAIQRRFVLHGLGGSGKTQICLKYAQTHRERYWGIFWVDASTHVSIQHSLKSIAKLLSTEITVDSVKRALANSPHNWLLIFDNSDDPELHLTTYFPTGDRGDIIITSRNPSSCQYNTVGAEEIGKMSLEDSVTLLQKTIYRDTVPIDTAHKEGVIIVETLGRLALAVTQAGAYIRETSCSFQDYIELYRRRKEEIWAYRPKHSGTDYHHTVYTTWQVSLEMIASIQEDISEYAIRFLKLICFYHHERIPLAIFFTAWLNRPEENQQTTVWFPWPPNVLDVFELRQIIQRYVVLLTSYSLVTRDSNDTLSFHPLVQEWCQEQMSIDECLAGCLRALSILVRCNDWEHTEYYSFERVWVSHALACFHKFKMLGAEIGEADGDLECNGWFNLATIFGESGFYKDAVTILEQVLELQKSKLGDDHYYTLLSMHVLAVRYSEAGRRDRALQLTEQVVQLRKTKLGEAHIDTLRSMHSLSIRYEEVGRQAESLKMAKHAFRLRMDTLGEEHSDTISSMQFLACLYSDLERHDDAIQLTKRLVQLRREIMGERHPQTLLLMQTLARCYSKVGRIEEAVQLSEQATDWTKLAFGEDHPNTLSAMLALACTYDKVERHQEVLELIEHVVQLARDRLGEEHPITLMALTNRASYYSDAGRPDKALQLKEEVLRLNKSNFGEDHPYTLAATLNLAFTYSHLGRIKEAVEVTEQVVRLQKSKLGAEHPDTLSSMRKLAIHYENAGRQGDALQLTEHVVQVLSATLGQEHLRTLSSLDSLAQRYWKAGKREEALQLREQVVQGLKRNLNENHPDTLAAIDDLVTYYDKMGHDTEALQRTEQLVQLQRDKFGERHSATVRSMRNLAYFYNKVGRQSESLRLRLQVVELERDQLGEDHSDTLESMSYVAFLYSELGQQEVAVQITERILQTRHDKLGEKHPDTLNSMHFLALWYSRTGRDEALQLTVKVVDLRKSELGEDHPDTLVSMHNLAVRYLEAGHLEKALQTTEQVVHLRKTTLGENNLLTLNSMHNLAVQYNLVGRREEAMRLAEYVVQQRKSQLGEIHHDTLNSINFLDNLYSTPDEQMHETRSPKNRWSKLWQRFQPIRSPKVIENPDHA